MSETPRYFDLVKHEFSDETSQFDPKGYWVGGSEYYARDYTVYLPARLIRRAPDLIDEFIAKYSEESWLWGVEKFDDEPEAVEIGSFESFTN